MKSKFTIILCLIMGLSTVFSQTKNYGKVSYEKAINLSGKQRMLSMKIAKLKILKAVGASSMELTKEYKSSVTIFERNLKILDLNGKGQSPKVKALVRQETAEWNRFKTLIDKPVSDNEAILNQSEMLLSKCHNLVLAIEEESKFNKELAIAGNSSQKKIEIINTSGRQRMLTQKLCLYYAACRAFKKGKNSEAACSKYLNIYNKMNGVINDLIVSEFNSSEIDMTTSQILTVMDSDIEAHKKAFIDNKVPLQKVLETTNVLQELFNKLTNQYSL